MGKWGTGERGMEKRGRKNRKKGKGNGKLKRGTGNGERVKGARNKGKGKQAVVRNIINIRN